MFLLLTLNRLENCFAFSEKLINHILNLFGLNQKILSQEILFPNSFYATLQYLKKPKTLFNFVNSQENIFETMLWADIFYEGLVTKEITRKIKLNFSKDFFSKFVFAICKIM